jgi:hypothetical protein
MAATLPKPPGGTRTHHIADMKTVLMSRPGESPRVQVDAMALTANTLYFRLGQLLAEIPDLAIEPTTLEAASWLERAFEALEASGRLADVFQLRVAAENLSGGIRARHAETIAEILRRALVQVEPDVPPEVQGTFIIAKTAVDAFVAVQRILATAENNVVLVDPQADARTLTDVAVLVPDRVVVRVLADQDAQNGSLRSAAQRWMRQFGKARPLYVRLAAPGTVVDTLILVDGITAWALRQPLSKIGRSSYTSLVRMPPDTTSAMMNAYAARWRAAWAIFPEEQLRTSD